MFVVILYHFNNHWTIIIIDVIKRRLLFLNSQENSLHHFQIHTNVERFIKQVKLLAESQSLMMEMIHSYQQVNNYNCDLYTIENAQAVISYQNQLKVIKNTL